MSTEERRSMEQHRSEWFYYQTIASFTGDDAYRVYEHMVKMFLKVVDENGKTRYLKPAFLTVQRHCDYLERIIAFWASWGLILPELEKIPPDFKIVYKNMRLLTD